MSETLLLAQKLWAGSASLTSPLDGRLTPYWERSQDSSPTTATHAASLDEASMVHHVAIDAWKATHG